MEDLNKINKKVVNFNTRAYNPQTNQIEEFNLYDILQKDKWIILFFWPLDFTIVCPTEIKAMSAMADEFDKHNTMIFGISTDSVESHKTWCHLPLEQNGLGNIKFPMLEDKNLNISKQFGVLDEEKGIAYRATFIISPDGLMQSSLINNTNVGRNTEEILRTLIAFQTGGLCVVNWDLEDEVL